MLGTEPWLLRNSFEWYAGSRISSIEEPFERCRIQSYCNLMTDCWLVLLYSSCWFWIWFSALLQISYNWSIVRLRCATHQHRSDIPRHCDLSTQKNYYFILPPPIYEYDTQTVVLCDRSYRTYAIWFEQNTNRNPNPDHDQIWSRPGQSLCSNQISLDSISNRNSIPSKIYEILGER